MAIALSYSKWDTYKTCPRKYWYSYIDEDRPKYEDGGASTPDWQGNVDKHKQYEEILLGTKPNTIFGYWREPFDKLIEAGAAAEHQVAFTKDWQQCDWFAADAAYRIIMDAHYLRGDGERGVVVDFKSGKVKTTGWLDQVELYALAIFLLYETVGMVETELWYTNHDHRTRAQFARWQVASIKAKWAKRLMELDAKGVTEDCFPKHPSRLCGWCKFHKDKGGPCDGLI